MRQAGESTSPCTPHLIYLTLFINMMQIVKVTYIPDSRALRYSSNTVISVSNDSNSTLLRFIIPSEYEDYQKYITFDVKLKDKEGELYNPTYFLEADNTFLIPQEITSSSPGKLIRYNLVLVQGEYTEYSRYAVIYVDKSSPVDPEHIQGGTKYLQTGTVTITPEDFVDNLAIVNFVPTFYRSDDARKTFIHPNVLTSYSVISDSYDNNDICAEQELSLKDISANTSQSPSYTLTFVCAEVPEEEMYIDVVIF